ncbi:transcriptional regulator, AraC family protein [Gordonia neofelifaecis NRRL B-59395]|uniref:Transcriptional regulator, AraC family protein n=1 Tax=Gordonia neofelifaecis NRRL B-59395 TaxID=644548 RepID=F1YJT0_9ACTN|nr:transcriptional regulator, AraC family protein [Gordonia neofelifaecis NRRL B-59395]
MLHMLRMSGTFYCQAELSEPWALQMPAIADSVSFHVVTAGTCLLRVADRPPVELRAGDLALVPRGLGHDLLSDLDSGPGPRVDLLPQEYLSPRYSVLRYGGSGRTAQLICGIVSFDDPAARELMRTLPTVLSISGDSPAAASSVRDTLRLMAGELVRPQPGGEAVATRLADILVVQAIRAWIAEGEQPAAGWLRGIRDERIGLALEAIHAEPGREWNLERLAQVAAMSRSSFSVRFTETVGESPMAYLARWRMSIAESRLRREHVTAAGLATQLGYRSEAAFNRAFTRIVGRTPGSVARDEVPGP